MAQYIEANEDPVSEESHQEIDKGFSHIERADARDLKTKTNILSKRFIDIHVTQGTVLINKRAQRDVS